MQEFTPAILPYTININFIPTNHTPIVPFSETSGPN